MSKKRHFEILKNGKNRKKKIVVLVLYKTDEYSYIHTPHTDKRYDEWVNNRDLISNPLSSPDVIEELTDEVYTTNEEETGVTLVRNCEFLIFGRWLLKCWYYSPFAFPNNDLFIKTLSVCPNCLLYYTIETDYLSHCASCSFTMPGSLIYQSGKFKKSSLTFDGNAHKNESLSIYCVDGKTDKLFAQNICLAGKLFIDHKTIMYDLEPFLLYVLVRQSFDSGITEMIGFFSKEKVSPEFHTLSCILIFPQYQRKGYGRLLMEFSYELYKKQGFIGGPERPLSDLGLVGYFHYWKSVLICLFYENPNKNLTLEEICICTAFRAHDVLYTLEKLDLLRFWNEGYVSSRNHSVSTTGGFIIPYQEIIKIVESEFPKKEGRKDRFKRMFDPDSFVKNNGVENSYL